MDGKQSRSLWVPVEIKTTPKPNNILLLLLFCECFLIVLLIGCNPQEQPTVQQEQDARERAEAIRQVDEIISAQAKRADNNAKREKRREDEAVKKSELLKQKDAEEQRMDQLVQEELKKRGVVVNPTEIKTFDEFQDEYERSDRIHLMIPVIVIISGIIFAIIGAILSKAD